MNRFTAPLALLVLAAPPVLAQDASATDARFPASTALAQGVSPDSLAALSDLVSGFVTDGDVVGAELMVIKDGRTILHEGHGWRDREDEIPMAPGGVFCVRSMTKPLTGLAVRMLVEDDLVELDDPISKYIPSFDVDDKREITVDMLLHHTSGLPMSCITGTNLASVDGIRSVADLGADAELEFAPGTDFNYSDQGTDTLTAMIEVVTGAPPEDFFRARILEPLGMTDSTLVLTDDHPLRARASSKYAGSPGNWNRYWKTDEPTLFPCFLGSQGLYSTLEDYARFCDLWLHRGKVGRERLVKSLSVRKTLRPGPHPMKASTAFPDLDAAYGSMMQLWTRTDDDGDAEVVVFGHTGSDGTHAWIFPEQKAIVLYFTQSRGTMTGMRVEEQLGDLFLGVPFDPITAAPPLEQYLGYYREHERDQYRSILLHDGGLAYEVVGKAIVPLSYVGEDRWKLRPDPSKVIEFDRDASGVVTGYHIGDHVEFRFEPDPDLPTAAEIGARVAETHRIDLLETVGPIRMRSSIEMEGRGALGESVSWLAWPNQWRVDETAAGAHERVAFDGVRVLQASGDASPVEVDGDFAAALRRDSAFARYGDWAKHFPGMRPIQRVQAGDDDILLLRAGDTSAPAATFYVDLGTGRLGRVDEMTVIPGMGSIGRRLEFRDFRDVDGVLLPFQTRVRLANRMIGTIVTTVEEVETGVEIPEGHFRLED